MTEEVTSCKICAEQFGIRWVPVDDYYNYVCTVRQSSATRLTMLGRLRRWLGLA